MSGTGSRQLSVNFVSALLWACLSLIATPMALPVFCQEASAPPDGSAPDDAEKADPFDRASERLARNAAATTDLASGEEETAAEAPSSVTVIERFDLDRFGVRYVSDLLRWIPGAEVQRSTATESNVNVRGYNDVASSAQGMMALLDGRQVYNEFYGNVFWDSIPVLPFDVEKIEFIRGPSSFLYGPNAMQGIVNIITRSPLDYERDELHLTLAGGSYDSSLAGLTFVRRSGDSGLKTTLSWDDLSKFDAPGENARDKGHVELRYGEEWEGGRFEISGGVSDQDQQTLIPDLELGFPGGVFESELQDSFLMATLDHEKLRARLSWNGFDSESIPNQIFSPFNVTMDVIDLDLQYSPTLLDGHSTLVGTGYRFSTFETKNLDVSLGSHQTKLTWAFVQDEFHLSDSILLTAGLRVDQHSTAGTNLSPRAALVWEFRPQQYLRASFGSGFRNPSLRELWFNMPLTIPGNPNGGLFIGNKDLEAERLQAYEIGYSGQPAGGIRLGATVFYNLVKDLIQYRPVPPGPVLVLAPLNQAEEVSYGLELEGDVVLSDSVSSFGNYSYTMRRRNEHPRERVPSGPRHKGNFGLRYKTGGPVTAMVWVNYFGETQLKTQVDEYALVNAQVAYRFPWKDREGELFLRVFNLLDNDHREAAEGDEYGAIALLGVSFTW